MNRIEISFKYRINMILEIISTFYNNIILLLLGIPKIKSIDETINIINTNSYSVSRYGDGEFTLMNKGDLMFQKYEHELELRLKEIIKSNETNHIVCIPRVFDNKNELSDHTRIYWEKFINLNRSKIYKMIDINKIYYDAFMTRLYMEQKDKAKAKYRFENIGKLWENKNIVIVEGEKSRLGIGNNLFDNSKSIQRIICPEVDAFSKYKSILSEVKKSNKSSIILIALGPTATVLSYDLSRYGYQAIDIGHIDIEYEWFLKGSLKKEPIYNKYVGEVLNGTEVNDINDNLYKNQIICKVI